MSSITTHVLDLSLGKPAARVSVRLEHLAGGGWTRLAERETDEDGRVRDLLDDHVQPAAGVYRLTFGVRRYFHGRGLPTFYPEIPILFEIGDPAQHYHVPLLVSPHGYSTYRGS